MCKTALHILGQHCPEICSPPTARKRVMWSTALVPPIWAFKQFTVLQSDISSHEVLYQSLMAATVLCHNQNGPHQSGSPTKISCHDWAAGQKHIGFALNRHKTYQM